MIEQWNFNNTRKHQSKPINHLLNQALMIKMAKFNSRYISYEHAMAIYTTLNLNMQRNLLIK